MIYRFSFASLLVLTLGTELMKHQYHRFYKNTADGPIGTVRPRDLCLQIMYNYFMIGKLGEISAWGRRALRPLTAEPDTESCMRGSSK